MTKRLKPAKILVVCDNPGGVNAALPVVADLQLGGANCIVVTTAYGSDKFNKLSVPVTVMNGTVSDVLVDDLLNENTPDLVLLGTSEPNANTVYRIESNFTNAAKRRKIPTLTILDHWCGYRARFSLSTANKLDAVPDFICVMDQRAKDEMVKEGFSSEKIVITGNPNWDRLREIKEELSKVDRRALRKFFGLDSKTKLLLFLSQPLSQHGCSGNALSELSILDELIEQLKSNTNLKDLVLWVKPHPRDSLSTLEQAAAKLSQKVKILDSQTNLYNLGFIADRVVGVFTMVLVEYALLGIPAVSYQPTTNPFELGFNVPVINRKDELVNYLVGSVDFKLSDRPVSCEATAAVVRVINDLLERN